MEDKGTSHFKEIFWYVVGLSVGVMLYVVAVTFINIPKEASGYVNIAFGFLLNMFASNSAYLTGGNPNNNKKNDGDTTLPVGGKSQVTTTIMSESTINKTNNNEASQKTV
jgi:hypothetical protein